MKGSKIQVKQRENLQQNYDICTILTKHNSPLSYEHLMYAILNQRISLPKILYFRQQKYKKEEPPLRRTFVVADALELSQQNVGRGWKFQNSRSRGKGEEVFSPHRQQKSTSIDLEKGNKQERGDIIKQKSPNPEMGQKQEVGVSRQRAKRRIKQIEEEMDVCQANLNGSRNEEEAALFQSKYNQLQKQLSHIRNRRRLQRQRQELKKVYEEGQEVPESVREIISNMNALKLQENKILNKQTQFKQKMNKTEEVERLKQIFKFYAKSNGPNDLKYFSDLEKDVNHLTIQGFMKFTKDWHLARIITTDEVIRLFKNRRKGSHTVTFGQFYDVLNDVHNYECIKEDKQFNAATLSKYFQDYIVCEQKMLKIYNKSTNIKGNSYSFKPRSHSGKYLADIESDLKEKKVQLNFLASQQNNLKFRQKKMQQKQLKNESRGASRQKNTSNNTSFLASQCQETSNSYAFRFHQGKKRQSRIKTEEVSSFFRQDPLKEAQKTENMILRQKIAQSQENTFEADSAKVLTSRPDPILEQFEDLIEVSQQDEYLSKHLMLPPIEKKRVRHSTVHY